MKSIVKIILSFLCLIFTALLFQNCSGDHGGVTVDNPLSVEDKLVKVGFSAQGVSGTTINLCIRKLSLRVLKFEDDSIGYPGDNETSVTVGIVRDVTKNAIGELNAKWPSGPEEHPLIAAKFEQDYRTVTLNENLETVVYELILPNGEYDHLEFAAFSGMCPLIENKSITVDNPFGTFTSNTSFIFEHHEPFIVEDEKTVSKNLDGEFLSNGVSSVQSELELDTFIINNYRTFTP